MKANLSIKNAAFFFDKTFVFAILSALAFWAAFPPLKFSFLIWLVPLFWAYLIEHSHSYKTSSKSENEGLFSFNKKISLDNAFSFRIASVFYLKIWLAGTLFWLLVFNWVEEFSYNWGIVFLWLFCSLVVSMYWPLYIGLSRFAVHKVGLPIIVVTPAIWCGLEWTRKNWLLGGFSFGSLEHSLYENTTFIQIADIFGEYTVGMFVIFVGSCFSRILLRSQQKSIIFPRFKIINTSKFTLISVLSVLSMVIIYGKYCLFHIDADTNYFSPVDSRKIALIQGNIDATIDSSREQIEQSLAQCIKITEQIGPHVDLVVWPESISLGSNLDFKKGFIPQGWEKESKKSLKSMLLHTQNNLRQPFLALAKRSETNVLLNVMTSSFSNEKRSIQNSAILISDKSGLITRYDKVNLATFIEYNPFAKYFSDEYTPFRQYTPGNIEPLFPIRLNPNRIESHQDNTESFPKIQEKDSFFASINICYDSAFPHFIREQIKKQNSKGKSPDMIINIANDMSWRFTTLIEMHLATHVFRAVETRRPYLTATNAGYSAWINRKGQIIKKGEKGASTYIIADIQKQKPITSWYMYWGDWLPFCCFLFNLFLVGYWIIEKFKVKIKSIPLSHSKTSITHNG